VIASDHGRRRPGTREAYFLGVKNPAGLFRVVSGPRGTGSLSAGDLAGGELWMAPAGGGNHRARQLKKMRSVRKQTASRRRHARRGRGEAKNDDGPHPDRGRTRRIIFSRPDRMREVRRGKERKRKANEMTGRDVNIDGAEERLARGGAAIYVRAASSGPRRDARFVFLFSVSRGRAERKGLFVSF